MLCALLMLLVVSESVYSVYSRLIVMRLFVIHIRRKFSRVWVGVGCVFDVVGRLLIRDH